MQACGTLKLINLTKERRCYMKPLRRNTHYAIFATFLLASLNPALAEDNEVAATPYRPSVSNPAALSEPGWLELELGTQRIKGGGDKMRDSFPVLAKLAFTENWGILLGSEMAVQRTDLSDQVFNGNGDTLIVLKHRMPTDTEDTAFGLELGYKSPSASETIGSGQADTSINGIFSTKIAGNDVDINLGATHVGGVPENVDTYMYSWAAAVGHGLNEQWGVFAEVSGTEQRGTPSRAQIMAGITYTLNRRVVFDAGAARGLNTDSPDSILFAGVTVLAGKLW